MKVCRAMVEEKLANKVIMYGTNTGIGEPTPVEQVRAALVKSGELLEEMEKLAGELANDVWGRTLFLPS